MSTVTTKTLPFHLPLIGEEEIDAAVEVLRSGWLTTGPRVKRLEKEFAAYVGAPHSIALNSGTAALHLALDAIGLKQGDEVIVPTLTFAASGEVVTYFGARPVLVDCEPYSFTINLIDVERAITPRTRAIVPVHFAGHPCEMDQLLEIAGRHGIRIIEDAAHALPAKYKGRMIGTIGDITCFSCYATKTITTGGEGGFAVTLNSDFADTMRMKSLHGISKDAWNRYAPDGSWRYEILDSGYKYNLTDLAAAIGSVQLKKCDRMRQRRAELAARYTRWFANHDAFSLPEVKPHVTHAWHLFVVLTNPDVLSIGRDQLVTELNQRGIGTSVHFIPLHLHPYYQKTWSYKPGDFPIAEDYFERCLSLPIYPGMLDEDVDRITETLGLIARQYRR